ncbi:MAG: dihydroorotase [Ruminococcus sp.]|nr:dihydroorotase [Ruminococcus sp.]
MQKSILLKNITVVNESEQVKCDVFIKDGVIADIQKNLSVNADCCIDGNSLVAMPSLFDMHVHLRDPGFTQKEDIITGTAAALAGGFTGVACMPNTKPAIDSLKVIKYIEDKSKNTGVSVYPVACITKSMQGNELCDYTEFKSNGIRAISDDGRPVENAEMMRKAFEEAKKQDLLVISHCEDLSIINKGIINKGSVSEELGVNGMDRSSEDYITAREIILAANLNAKIHIAHVSTRGSVEIIRQAKAHGVKVTCETCPHYFLMTEEVVKTKDADYRMNPPLREEEDRLAVLEGVLDGTIDCIVTDHAPHTMEEKADFYTAPNGVIGMETSLAATLTLYHENKITLYDIVNKMSVQPRKLLGIPVESIEIGKPANIVLVDLEYMWTVKPEKLHSKARNAVFKNKEFKGKPVMTISNGEIRYSDNEYFKEVNS